MKKLILFPLALLFSLVVLSCSGDSENVQLSYEIVFLTEENTVSSVVTEETKEWEPLVIESILLLPNRVHAVITDNFTREIPIYIGHYPGREAAGEAVIKENGEKHLRLNAAVLNERTVEERHLTIIHELGHLYNRSDTPFTVYAFVERFIDKTSGTLIEMPLAVFHIKEVEENGKITKQYFPEEDYADTFAFFVLWPEALQKCCTLRYGFTEELFGREYKAFGDIANSSLIKSNLSFNMDN